MHQSKTFILKFRLISFLLLPIFVFGLFGTFSKTNADTTLDFTETYTNGTTSWVAPADVTSAAIEAWGGGGAGGGVTGNANANGGGGAGGAYAKKASYSLTPGNSYTVSIAGTKAGTTGSGSQGDPTWFSSNDTNGVVANGGAGGTAATANNTNGAGGTGSSATSFGDVGSVFHGGNGNAGVGNTRGGPGGGGAGSTGNGGNATTTTGGTGASQNGGNGGSGGGNNAAGGAGSSYGGGGGGARNGSNNSTDRNGGTGAAGLLKISYSITDPAAGVTFVSAGTHLDSSTTSGSVPLPSGIQEGDLLLMVIAGRPSGSSGTNDAITPPGTWTLRGSKQRFEVGTNDLVLAVYYKIAGSSESNPSVTVGSAFNGTSAGWSGQIAAYRGVDQSSPFDLVSPSAGTNAAAANFTPSAVTTNTTRARVISIVATADDNTLDGIQPFAGFTERMSGSGYNATAGGDHAVGLSDRPVITPGSTSIIQWSETGNGNDGWAYLTDALKPASVLFGDGTDGSNSTIAPGAGATEIDRFSLLTLSGTDTVTDLTVTLAPANAYNNVASVSVQTTGGTPLCTLAGLSSNTVNLTSCNISVTTSETEYKVTITPKTHANMPAVPGASYATTATVTSITTTGSNGGSDADSATITVDNASPNSATSASGTSGDAKVTLAWTTASGETTNSVVLRWAAASPGGDVPVEGATYSAGNTIGSATVACVFSSQSSATSLSGKVDGSGGSSGCNTSSLSNGTQYSYKIFEQDANGNYDAGVAVTGNPFTPEPPISISGTCKQKDFSTDCTDTGTLKFAVNGSLQAQTQATVAGTWSITGITAPAAGSVITVFIDGAADANEAVGITKYDGSGDISIALIESFVILGSDDTGITLSNTDLGQYDGDNDEDLPFTSNSGSLSGGTTSLALTAGTYSPGGSVTVNTFLQAGGTVNGGSASWELTEGSGGLSLYIGSGTFTATSGTTTVSGYNSLISISGSATFNHGGGTFYLGTGDYVGIDPNGAQFNNVIVDKGGCCGSVVVSGTWRIAGDLTVNNLGNGGFYDAGSGSIELSGNFSTNTTHSNGSVLLKFVGTGTQTVNGNGVDDAGLPVVEVAKPSGTLSFTGEEFKIMAYNNGWKYTSGTVDMGDSAILFSGGHIVIDAAGMSFNNVLIDETDCCGETTLNSSLTVAGSLEVNNAGVSGFIGGQTVYVGGDLEVDNADDCLPPRGGCDDARGVNFVLNGTGAQVLTDDSGTMPTGTITINKASGTVTLGADLTTYGNLIITSGTLDQTDDLTVNGTVTVSSGGIWNDTSADGVITLGGDVTNNGTINLDAHGNGCGDTDDIILTSTNTTKRTWSGSGIFSLSDLTVSYMQGTVTVSSSTNGGNNTGWTFGGCGVTISGTVYSDQGSTPITSGPTVRIKLNGAGSYSTTANGSGVYSISSVPVSFGNVITVYLDGATPKAVTVTRAGGATSDISGLNLWQNYLVVRHEDSGPVTNTNLGTYDKDDDSDIFFTANSGTLTVDSGKTLYIATGKTFSPDGNVATDKLSIFGTYDNATSNPNLSLTGDLTIASGGTFTKGSGTLTLKGGSSQEITDSNDTKQDLGTIAISGSGNASTATSWCIISTYCTSSWTYRRQILFNNSVSTTNLTNFPVLVHLASDSFDFSKTKESGADIRFVDADGTSSLSYEIESWAPTTKGAYIWVKVPQLDHTNSDYIWMYYGNAGASDAQAATGVWDSNYAGVWHMNQTPSAAQLDSTSNGNNGTSTNLESGDQVASQIGGGLQLDGTNEKIAVSDSNSLDVTNYTAEAVVSLTTISSETFIFERGSSDLSQDNFYLWYDNTGGSWVYGFRDTTDFYDHYYDEPSVPTNERHMAVVLDTAADTISLYINGLQVDSESESHTPATTGTQVLSWGLSTESGASNVGVVGIMDEARLSTVARSSDWINAEYRSSMGLMATIGGEETSSATPDAWCNISTDCTEDWGLRQKVYFNNSASTTNLTNFPVLVHLASDSFDFSKINADGGDIRFVDADGTTLLPYEVDTWAPTTKGAYIWVKVPQLDHTNSDYIWMYYGNAGATNPDLNSVGAGESRLGTSATGTGWTNPTNVLNEETDQYATYAAAAQAPLIITGFGYDIPSDATITGFYIFAYGFGNSGTASNRSVQFGLTKDGSSIAGSYASSVNLAATGTGFDDEFVSVGNSTSLFGTTWTPADINSSNFGIMIRAGNTDTSGRNIILAEVVVSFTTPYGADSVWDSGYKGVWHFNLETFGGDNLLYNSMAPQTNSAFSVDSDWTPNTGVVSNAVDIEGAFSPGESYAPPGNFTVSGWIKTTSLDNIDQVSVYGSGAYPDSGFDILDQGPYHNYVLFRLYPSSVTSEAGGQSCDTATHVGEACIPRSMINDGQWHWLVAMYDGEAIYIVLDGNLIDAQSAGTYVQNPGNFIYLGSGGHPITYDEFRLSTVSRSEDWLITEYRSMLGIMDTFSPAEVGSGDPSTVNVASPIKVSSLTIPSDQRLNLGTNTLTLTGDLTNNGILDGSSGNIVIEPAAATVTLGGTASMSFNNFTATGAGKTVKVKASKQITINGTLTLSGSPTQPLVFSSDTPGSQWNIIFHGAPSFSFVNIKDIGCGAGSSDIYLNEKSFSLGNNGSCWKLFNRGAGGSGSSAPAEGGAGGSGSTSGGGTGGGSGSSDGEGAGGSGSQGGGGQSGGGGASP